MFYKSPEPNKSTMSYTSKELEEKYEMLWDQQDILFNTISEIQQNNTKSKENIDLVLNNQTSEKAKVHKIKYDLETYNFKLDNMNAKLIEITELVSRMKQQNQVIQYDLCKIKKINHNTYSYSKWYWFVGIIVVLYIIGKTS
jgi:hypothetical protein